MLTLAEPRACYSFGGGVDAASLASELGGADEATDERALRFQILG
jgi:hypothetical protein